MAWLQEYGALVALFSFAMFVGTLIVIPIAVVRIPADYFCRDPNQHRLWSGTHPAVRMVLLGCKNLLGLTLILMGVAMLVLPGQGLLTILIGLMLLNFPGKHRLERKLLAQPPIFRSANWFRRRAGRPPLRKSILDS